jgi:hypothetical protein
MSSPFSRFVRLSLIQAPLWMLVFIPQHGIAGGVVAGAMMAVVFTALYLGLMAWQSGRARRALELEIGEQILHDGPANLFRGPEGVGGWLFLTNRYLRFRPHAINLQKQPFDARLPDVVDARAVNTAWVIPNGLLVSTPDGDFRFVVHSRGAWVHALGAAGAGRPAPRAARA